MTCLGRLNLIRILAFAMLLNAPAAYGARQLPPLAEQMAKTYGLDSFGQVEGIRYMFNLNLPSLTRSETWEWNPKTNRITYEGKDKNGKPIEVSYQRSQLGNQSDVVRKEIDPKFLNDQYWLLFPFHVVWDGATVTDEGMRKLPLGEGSADLIRVKYRSDRGYTPGDTWDLYIGPDKRVKEMFYHRGGSTKPSAVIVTWAGYKKAVPLLFSTEHRGTADGEPVRLTFSDVSVKMVGSDAWIRAQ